jgi:hypothetical protein
MLTQQIKNDIKKRLANNGSGTWKTAEDFINDSKDFISQLVEKIQIDRENHNEKKIKKEELEHLVEEYYVFILGNYSDYFIKH